MTEERKFQVGDIILFRGDGSRKYYVTSLASNSRGPYVRVGALDDGSSGAFYEWDIELDAPRDDHGRASIEAGAEEYEMIMRIQDGQ